MEYTDFAQYYDIFYKNKDYKKEVTFLNNFINKNDKIIDIGCGTGIHASYLEKNGHYVDCLDLNSEMLAIAKKRVHGNFYNQNILELRLDKKYDVIISMFAVLNHLSSKNELIKAFDNMKNIMHKNSKLIIDLHNPQSSGEKTDHFNDIERTMKWEFNKDKMMEYSTINFKFNDKTYEDGHVFKIFTIEEVIECAKASGLFVSNVYSNYCIDEIGTKESKNLQFLIELK